MLMLKHNREQERKQDNRQNQELPNIESNCQEIIEEDKKIQHIYTNTKDTNKPNKT